MGYYDEAYYYVISRATNEPVALFNPKTGEIETRDHALFSLWEQNNGFKDGCEIETGLMPPADDPYLLGESTMKVYPGDDAFPEGVAVYLGHNGNLYTIDTRYGPIIRFT